MFQGTIHDSHFTHSHKIKKVPAAHKSNTLLQERPLQMRTTCTHADAGCPTSVQCSVLLAQIFFIGNFLTIEQMLSSLLSTLHLCCFDKAGEIFITRFATAYIATEDSDYVKA